MATFVAWALIGGIPPASATPPTPVTPTITVKPSHSRIVSGKPVVLSGRVRGEVTSTRVDLYASPYPYRSWRLAARTMTASNGSYSFSRRPDLNTRYRVSVPGTTAQATASVGVMARAIIRERPLPLGRAEVRIVVIHPASLKWWFPRTYWQLASGAPKGFHHGPTVSGIKLSRTKLLIRVKMTLPAGRYYWRVCFHPAHSLAMTAGHPPPGCTGQGYQGKGWLPHGFPGRLRIARAEHYLKSRGGRTALAVVDTEGRMHGMNLNEQFITGSVVKAMLLVAYLRRLHRMGQHHISSSDNSFLYPMIHVSDNNAATHTWDIVGNSGLYEVAHAAGMTHFSVDTSASWGSEWGAALITAADQAKFFFEMDSLIPKEFVGYANYLLSTIASYESWGIPAVARPLGYKVFWKAGWRPSPDIFLVHQIARLEKDGKKFSIAIMTDGDPNMGYGIATIEGATRALLG